MAHALRLSVRAAAGASFAVMLVQACGGLDSGTVTLIRDGAPSGGKAGTAGTEQGGAAGDMGSPNGVGGAGNECVEGASCSGGPDGGICVTGVCSSCAGPKDDLACVRAYGKGHLCIDGGCVKANCHTETDCAAGAGICTNHQCMLCTKDTDCVGAGATCNTSTGACVTNASCGNLIKGSACPINSADLCCG